MHKYYIDEIIAKGTDKQMQEMKNLLIDTIDDLDCEDKTEVEMKLHKILYGDHLGEKLARKWVANMKNKDGTTGEHWNYDQTSQYAGTHDKWDYYAVLNMMYSDYYSPKYDSSVYITLANDWMEDADVEHCKTLKYYYYVV